MVLNFGCLCRKPQRFNVTYTHVRDFLGLFRNGYDSLEISYISGLPEPTVYNQLHEQREAERLKAPKPNNKD